ncbi:MAG: hypothetical protein NTX49_01560 [Chlamydiae bacterium]|nr:hypothetical protein [Chlamydiota bacterium]
MLSIAYSTFRVTVVVLAALQVPSTSPSKARPETPKALLAGNVSSGKTWHTHH